MLNIWESDVKIAMVHVTKSQHNHLLSLKNPTKILF